jgi:hypothetical protein
MTVNAQLYSEGFEGFSVGDYIGESSPVWTTWSGTTGSDEDAQVSDEQAHEGANSLKIIQTAAAGGVMDVVLIAGLDGGAYDVSFYMYIPTGSSGYYNFQESETPGVGWAFEVYFSSEGTCEYNMDGAVVGGGDFPLDQWFHINHMIDTDNDQIVVKYDDVIYADFLFDTPFGGINFFAAGDGVTMGTYYVDDVVIAEAILEDVAEATPPSNFEFGPNPAVDFIQLQTEGTEGLLNIYALNGQVVKHLPLSEVKQGQQIPLNLTEGIYFIEVQTATERTTKRLVIHQ